MVKSHSPARATEYFVEVLKMTLLECLALDGTAWRSWKKSTNGNHYWLPVQYDSLLLL